MKKQQAVSPCLTTLPTFPAVTVLTHLFLVLVPKMQLVVLLLEGFSTQHKSCLLFTTPTATTKRTHKPRPLNP